MTKKILYLIGISRTREIENRNRMNNITLPAFFESVNHPRTRFLFDKKLTILALLTGLFALIGCEGAALKTSVPDPEGVSLNVSGVVAEGALIKGASVSLYLSGADSSLDSTTSDNQGRYSFTLEEDIRESAFSLRLVATYMKAGEMTTFRSYVDLRGMTSSQSLTANINEITEFAFTLASVQTEIDEETLNTLNRIIDRVSDVLGEENLDFRTSSYNQDLDSYQELIQFQEQTGDPSMIDILQKDDGSPLVSFEKTLLTEANRPTEDIRQAMDDFLANDEIINEINEINALPIPTLASGAPGEVTDLQVEVVEDKIILSWINPDDLDFDHVEISWMTHGGNSSEPVTVSSGQRTNIISGLERNVPYTFTIITFDSEGNDSAGVRIMAELMQLSFGVASVPNQIYIVDTKITDLMLPAATGGNGDLAYTLTPELPNGLTFNDATRILSGTPTVSKSETEYTYTVTDADGDTDMLTFTITVMETDISPSLGGEIVSAQSYIVDTKITDLMLPAATGGNGDLDYDLSPSLPNGLTFNATTRILSGTPTEIQIETQYTYTVTDADGDTDMLTFTITVMETDISPSLGGEIVAAQSYIMDTKITDLVLPMATGGNGNLDYDLSPSLPIGLTFNAITRTLSGTPTVPKSETQYTYTVTDADGDTDMLTFTITVMETDISPSLGGEIVAAQSYIVNTKITDLMLPAATGGNGNLAYTIMTELPNGLTFNDATRTLSGTPTVSKSETEYTYTVTDADGDTDMLTFTITVAEDLMPSLGGEIVAAQSYIMDTKITDLMLPMATGGNGNLDYDLSPSLPIGLTFNAITRTLSGTPTVPKSETQYTYTVTDADGDTDMLTFTITVMETDISPSLGGEIVAAQSYIVNTKITDLMLPAATGGNGNLAYTIMTELPNGLTFNDATRTLSGTPTVSKSETEYTYTVTDADGDTDMLTFTITVMETDISPSLGGEIVAAQSYIMDTKITDLVLPMATGGNGNLDYDLSPSLPIGLTFNAITRTLSGTPTVPKSETQYTYTVTDADGDTDMLTFTITVMETDISPSLGGEIVAAQSYIVNTKITDLMLPAATGGNGNLAYTIMTELPNGLTFNDATRTLSGTPTVSKSETEYTYTVTDADGDTDMLTFTITVAEDLMPSLGGEIVAAQSYIMDTKITDLMLPMATGGNGELTYTIMTELPNGLTFNDATRILSGTPTVSKSETEYTYTVTDADGDTDMLTFTITVAEDLMPSLGGEIVAAQSYIMDTKITDLVLPMATGGNGDLAYTLTPELPNGLTFNDATRILSGTPTVSKSETEYTYTVTDADGDTDMLTFTITVAEDLMPSFSLGAIIDDQIYTANTGISALMLPAATGGNGNLDYDLSPSLPIGLTFNAITRTLSGTPTVPKSETQYTYTVTDADGDTDMLTFTITVMETDISPSLGGEIVAAQSYIVNTKITDLVLPAATGGNGDLAYTLTPELPNGLTFNAITRLLSGTPTVPKSETQYTYTVTDADGDTDMLTFTITVMAEVIQPITISGSSTGTVTEDGTSVVNETLTITNPNLSGDTTFVVQDSTAGTYGTFSITSGGVWTYTLNNSDSDTHALSATDTETETFTVMANADNAVTQEVVITVNGANDSPTAIIAGGNRSVASGATVNLDGRGSTDPDTKDTLTYSWTAEGGQGSFNDMASMTPTWTAPSVGINTDIVIMLAVSDATLSDTASVTITVMAEVIQPITISGSSIGTVTEDGTSVVNETLTITNPNLSGDTTFVVQDSTAGTYGTFSITSGGVWTYTLNNSDSDTHALSATDTETETFTVMANADNTVTQEVVITVNGANDGPTAIIAGGNRSVASGATVNLDGRGSTDPDTKDTLTYSWTAEGGQGSFNDMASMTPTWTAPSVGINTDIVIMLAVSDATLSDTASVTITVMAEVIQPITISGSSTGTVTEDGTSVVNETLTIANPNLSGDTTFVVQDSTAGAYGTFSITSGGVWTYTLNNSDSDTHALSATDTETETFTVMANADNTVTQEVVITVNGANDGPTAIIAGGNRSVASGATVNLDGRGSTDPDTKDTLTYSWTAEGGQGSFNDMASMTPTWTAPSVGINTDIVIMLAVSDKSNTL